MRIRMRIKNENKNENKNEKNPLSKKVNFGFSNTILYLKLVE